MTRFLLVHGAWGGGWVWDEVTAALSERGHSVEAPDLPCEELELTQLDYAAFLGPHGDAIVVGHSLAGQTIAHVDAAMRVYVGGIVPTVHRLSAAFTPTFGGMERDDDGRSYWPDVDVAHERLFPDCTREQVEAVLPRMRRQAPIGALRADLGPGDVVIVTARDDVISPDWQRAQPLRSLEIDAGHWPMLTHAVELAALLDSLS
jgi:pimeloyl-ACP methyl ester carboxylesterase